MWHKSGTVTFLLQFGTPDIVIVPRNDRSGLVRLWLVGFLVVLNPCASEEQCGHACDVNRIQTSRIPATDSTTLQWRGVPPAKYFDNYRCWGFGRSNHSFLAGASGTRGPSDMCGPPSRLSLIFVVSPEPALEVALLVAALRHQVEIVERPRSAQVIDLAELLKKSLGKGGAAARSIAHKAATTAQNPRCACWPLPAARPRRLPNANVRNARGRM
jgi:hypothetical protein